MTIREILERAIIVGIAVVAGQLILIKIGIIKLATGG
jgi:hypothetical protein